jgi:hypothetical protein
MPFQSDQQRKMMYAAADDPAVAKKMGISQDAARKFIADSGGKTLKQTVGDAVDKEAPGVMDKQASKDAGTDKTPDELQTKSKIPPNPKSPAKGKLETAAKQETPSTPNVDTKDLFKKTGATQVTKK